MSEVNDMSGVVLVTGAAGALGGVVCDTLTAAGLTVAALDLPSPHLDQLVASGRAAFALGLDVTDLGALRDAVRTIETNLGPITGAALIAGGFVYTGPLHLAEDDGAAAMFHMNVDTVSRGLRALLPGMVSRGGGSVVIIGARPGQRPWTGVGMASYTASKAAALALVQATAAEVLESGVRVNAVLPSTIDTPRNRQDMPQADPRRWVSPESIAGVIQFLLSDAARDISGALVPVYARA